MYTKKGLVGLVVNSNRITISIARVKYVVEIGYEDRIQTYSMKDLDKNVEKEFETEKQFIKACWKAIRKDNCVSGGNGVEVYVAEVKE